MAVDHLHSVSFDFSLASVSACSLPKIPVWDGPLSFDLAAPVPLDLHILQACLDVLSSC